MKWPYITLRSSPDRDRFRRTMNLLRLPAFAAGVFFMYWSLAVGCLTQIIPVFDSGPRNDMFCWSDLMKRAFGVRVLHVGSQQLIRDRQVVYLSNHRSWADFFIDCYITEGRGAFMSRMLVSAVFPVFIASCRILGGILLFKRTAIRDKVRFNDWIDAQLASSPGCRGLIVYPEGHRSRAPTSLPLKRGMGRYAFSRGIPVQIIISTNKEHIMSEKDMRVGFGKTLKAGFSRAISPADHPDDFEAFWRTIQSEWDDLWDVVFQHDPEGLPTLAPRPDLYDYPQDVRIRQALVACVSVLLLAATLVLGVWTTLAVTAMLGDVGKLLAAGSIIWSAASTVEAFLGPVHYTLPSESQPDRTHKKTS